MLLDPHTTVLEFGFIPGNKIADIGSGRGTYTFALAHALGPESNIIAIDLHDELLAALVREARTHDLSSIEVLQGNVEEEGGTKLRDELCDGAVCAYSLIQLNDKEKALREIHRIVRRGGRLCIVDRDDQALIRNHKSESSFSKEDVIDMCERAGFMFERYFEPGEYHYGLVFRK